MDYQEVIAEVKRRHFAELRHRMIRDTEAFLNDRLDGRDGHWPADQRGGPKLNPRGGNLDRRQAPSRAEPSVDIRTRPYCGTLVEVRPDARGVLDEPRLNALESQLHELSRDGSAGDIVIAVQHVAVMTAGFMSLLAIVRRRLAYQQRKLSLAGLRPECATVLVGTGLEALL